MPFSVTYRSRSYNANQNDNWIFQSEAKFNVLQGFIARELVEKT